KSDAIAKLDGTWRKPGVSAAAANSSQRTLGQNVSTAPAVKRQREEEEFVNYKRAADGGKQTDRELTPEIEMEDETEPSSTSGVSVDAKGEQEPLNRILYIQNLPPDVTDEMLSYLFEQYPGFKEVRLVPGKSDIAFVEYESDNQAAIAKEVLNGFKITHEKEMKAAKPSLEKKVAALEQFSKINKGVIELDSNLYDEFVAKPRNYSLIVLFTALEPHINCMPCKEFDPEFRLAAEGWIRSGNELSRLYFGVLDFKNGKEIYQKLNLNNAPSMLYFPPTTGPYAKEVSEPDKYDFNRRGLSAESLASYLSGHLGVNVPINRPPNYLVIGTRTKTPITALASSGDSTFVACSEEVIEYKGAIVEWVFDSANGVEPRLLKSRSGHHAPPSSIQYYDSDGHFILSAAGDRSLRVFSVVRDSQSVELSQGSSSGVIEMYNMQSGIHRRTFAGEEKHAKAISGLASDSLNRILISSSLDGTIKIWDFNTAKNLHTIKIMSPVTTIKFHTENDLLAIVSDDLCIRVMDVETRKIIREFWGHRNRVTDLTFSPDGRWIVSASLDATIRTWDLPTGHLVDVFEVDNVVTSMTFSPKGDFLATAHVDLFGIYLWANRTQFANVTLRRITDDEIISVELPTTSGIDGDVKDDFFIVDSEVGDKDSFETPEQLTEQMITLSSLPRSKWQNLLNLDTIKKRNKPKEPPKAPEKAPFFLPTLPGVNPKFVPALESYGTDNSKKIVKLGDVKLETEFTKILKNNYSKGEFDEFFNFAKTLNPSAIDFELRSLSLNNDFEDLKYFLDAIRSRLESRKDFELVQ
ncbi:11305_t:CDS:10, partial [Acaulospora colombiana]